MAVLAFVYLWLENYQPGTGNISQYWWSEYLFLREYVPWIIGFGAPYVFAHGFYRLWKVQKARSQLRELNDQKTRLNRELKAEEAKLRLEQGNVTKNEEEISGIEESNRPKPTAEELAAAEQKRGSDFLASVKREVEVQAGAG